MVSPRHDIELPDSHHGPPSLTSLMNPSETSIQYVSAFSQRGSLDSPLSTSRVMEGHNNIHLKSQQQELTPHQLELLVGKQYIQAAIFPDGSSRVSIVENQGPTFVLTTEPLPTTKPKKKIQGSAEELVLEVVPLESDHIVKNETGIDSSLSPNENEEKSTAYSDSRKEAIVCKDKQQVDESTDVISSIEDVKLKKNLNHVQEIEMTTENKKEVQIPKEEKSRLLSEETQLPKEEPLQIVRNREPEEFSVWKCFTRPYDAVNPSKSKGFATLRVMFNTCELIPATNQSPSVELRKNSNLSSEHDYGVENKRARTSPRRNSFSGFVTSGSQTFEETNLSQNSLLTLVVMSVDGKPLYRSRVIAPSMTSQWNEIIDVQIHNPYAIVTFELIDRDFITEDEDEAGHHLAGISVNLSDLECGQGYTAGIEMAIDLPATVPLIAAAKKAEQALEYEQQKDMEENDTKGRKRKSSDSIKPGASPISLTAIDQPLMSNPPFTIGIRVNIVLMLSYSGSIGWVSQLAALTTADKCQTNYDINDLAVESTTVDANHIRYCVLRLKQICWDSTLLPLRSKWVDITSWRNIPLSGSLLLIILFYVWYPTYSLAFLFGAFTVLLFWLPGVLPSLRPCNSSIPSSDAAKAVYSTEEDPVHSLKVYQHPSAAQPFLKSILTDDLLLVAKRLEISLEKTVNLAESAYNWLRATNASKSRRMLPIICGICSIASAAFPDTSTRYFGMLLGFVGLMFFCASLPPIKILLRTFKCIGICLKRWFGSVRHQQRLHTGLPIETF